MNNISITISTHDNRTQAFGYDPKFYEDENARNIDITNDMNRAKERFGDKVAIVSVAEWNDDVKNANGIVYESIDEVLEVYKLVEVKEPSETVEE
jgi:hypothetical protein